MRGKQMDLGKLKKALAGASLAGSAPVNQEAGAEAEMPADRISPAAAARIRRRVKISDVLKRK